MSLQSVNPATGEVLETFTPTSSRELDGIVAQSHAAFLEWRTVPFKVRAERMRQAAQILRRRRAEFARTMTLEMGKPITQGEAEADKCAWVCDYYADSAEGFLAVQPRETDAKKSYVRFDPLGVVLAVRPWNFPFWQVTGFAAPALMAGNAGVLKHASNVPRCALELEQLFRAAGFPESLFSTLLVGSKAVEGIIADRRIVAVTLTGSEQAGSKVAAQAGGGVKKNRPLARRHGPLHRAPGAFSPPTVLTAVDKGMPAFDEETFGPVAAVVRARDEDDAIRLANDSTFGLGASLWTQDRARAERLAARIEAGAVFVNGVVK